jgi:hypothetical protein
VEDRHDEADGREELADAVIDKSGVRADPTWADARRFAGRRRAGKIHATEDVDYVCVAGVAVCSRRAKYEYAATPSELITTANRFHAITGRDRISRP